MRKTDQYVVNALQLTYNHGISNYVGGVYDIVLGLLGCLGCACLWLFSCAMRNRSTKEYLVAKQRRPAEPKLGPVFVTLMEHPHRRSDAKLPEWRPLELPSAVQDRSSR